ncbi:MAG TPA: tRNA pseudouridine(55) synthase TruB [Vicinamibacteria bacterium]|nr:tRNA pseudouridine(55) synthase TruB [Vicinamibacteria bacterium]
MLVVDKPSGPTSHDVVDHVRRRLGQRRVGHTGTLDPFATGVLPVCLGHATRLARFFTEGEKEYRASIRLGFATTTDDLTGEPLHEPRPIAVEDDALRVACRALVGTLAQVPPAYSAKRVGGRRLYDLARAGQAVERAAVPVTVHAFDLLAPDGDRLEVEVRCAPGTYVRSLARDLGAALGIGAHLTALRRTRSGGFGLDVAVPLDDVDAGRVLPMEALLTEWPAVRLTARGREAVGHGRDITRDLATDDWPAAAPHVRLLDADARLVAVGVPRAGSTEGSDLAFPPALHPEIVFVR